MPGQIAVCRNRWQGSTESSQPRLASSAPARARVVEVAGTTTAECAAVWCCCPCGIANLFVFAVYRIPAGICRRAIRSRRRRRKSAEARVRVKGSVYECDLCEMGKDGGDVMMLEDLLKMKVGYGDDAAAEEEVAEDEVRLLEEEMLKKFYGSGFWRSPSRALSK